MSPGLQVIQEDPPPDLSPARDHNEDPPSSPASSDTRGIQEPRKGGKKWLPWRRKGRKGSRTEKLATRVTTEAREIDPDESNWDNSGTNGFGQALESGDEEVSEDTAVSREEIDGYLDRGIDLYVQVNRGFELPAKDQSGKSDPYCIVTSGSQKERTAIVKQDLSPVWNETFVFHAENVKQGGGRILFEVWDSDDWTKDDYIGKAEVDIYALNLSCASVKPYVLLLKEHTFRGVKDAGSISISCYWATCIINQASMASTKKRTGPDGASVRITSLCTPPGVRREIPRAIHSELGTLYEEPSLSIVFLRLKIELILPCDALAESAKSSYPIVNHTRALRSFISQGARKSKQNVSKAVQSLGRLRVSNLGGLGNPFDALRSLRSPSSSRDSVDLSLGSAALDKAEFVNNIANEIDEFDASLAADEEPNEEADGTSRSLLRQDSTEEAACSVVGGEVQMDPYMYYQASLGGQVQLSNTIESTRTASWDDGSVFVLPLPLKNRNLSLKLYTTQQPSSSKTKAKRKLMLNWKQVALFELLDCKAGTVWVAEGVAGLTGNLQAKAVAVHSDPRAMLYNLPIRLPGTHGFQTISEESGKEQPDEDPDEDSDIVELDSFLPASGGSTLSPSPAPMMKSPNALVGSLHFLIQSVDLMQPMECYCIAKCGPHWWKTCTRPQSRHLVWGWEIRVPIYDPSTLLTFAIFSESNRMQPKGVHARAPTGGSLIGKLRIRLSTLLPGKRYTCTLPFRSGGARTGEASLSIKVQYPCPVQLMQWYFKAECHEDIYRFALDNGQKGNTVKLMSAAIVERWLDGTAHRVPVAVTRKVVHLGRDDFAIKRTQVHIRRLSAMINKVTPLSKRFRELKAWKRPRDSALAILLCGIFIFYPHYAVAAGFMALGAWCSINYRIHKQPPFMDEAPLVLEEPEESATANKSTEVKNPYTMLRRKYARIQVIAMKVQNIIDMLAGGMERLHCLVCWRDPVATQLFTLIVFVAGLLIMKFGLRPVLFFAVAWILRHPCLRKPTPPAPYSFFCRLPAKSDQVL